MNGNHTYADGPFFKKQSCFATVRYLGGGGIVLLSETGARIQVEEVGVLKEDATGETWMRVNNGLSGRRGRPHHEKTAQR